MVQFIFDTLFRAADLALIAVALSAVYSLIRFPNVALVQYAVVGAFVGMALQQQGVPIVPAVLLASLLVGGIAQVFNAVIFQRLLRLDPAIALIGSLALSMVLSAGFLLGFGPAAQRFSVQVAPATRVFGVRVTEMQVLTGGLTVAILIAFALLLFRTPLGREMRAVSTNPVLAAATGVNTARVTGLVVFLSGVIAALGGAMLALRGSVSIDMGTNMLLPVFAAAILGGLGNAFGAVFGAIVIAAAETLITNLNFGPIVGQDHVFLPASYAPAASFALLVAVLLFRPRGIFVSEVTRV
ncbi:branched-chain amino acid ABC transporter permease [Frigidibacter albus]|uniref:Branched-chain amino acid ABC transporter permease n=1 Tax=Frigidibacter albus TaxID=1465486 RepID=A0A6L8VJD9_9RHOB|nr:branched-chain amino acid ABC transporter permease [Frigidibacter albus]MZQ89290.1 branched-chain amino acid ABC transporter permease [Frigidibacter albus]NBE31196.1 branched-chain amino acid ABC transporter permease [Frigidibacter albus]GGH53424.1 branched-chain amino acid ABC transporter permease [Frigidibacter albus]